MAIGTERISQTGLQIRLIASVTFPVGIDLVDFADDTDPFDGDDIEIVNRAIGLNGQQIVWSQPVLVEPTISIIPDSRDDINLSVLLEANRVGAGKNSAEDSIDITVIYPNGHQVNLLDGVIVSGPPFTSVSADRRSKTKTYQFSFSNKNVVRP